MSLESFKEKPWLSPHSTYKQSAFVISPAPEYASSEVLLASLYRSIGFASASEASVPQAGRELDKAIELRRRHKTQPEGATLGPDDWFTMLHGILESPKLPKQSKLRFIQMTPLVPEAALFSNSPRLRGNPWNPGLIVRNMVAMGTPDEASAQALWKDLFQALTIDDEDDVFARWLHREAQAWTGSTEWALVPLQEGETFRLARTDHDAIRFLPARRFSADLRAIIDIKARLTRRQWTSLLEAVLRLGAVAHVAWLCDVHERTWRVVRDSLAGHGPANEEEVRGQVFPLDANYMAYGAKALNSFKDLASSYLIARLGINTVLWALDEAGVKQSGDLSSSLGIATLCKVVRDQRVKLESMGTLDCFYDLAEQEARTLACDKGIGNNLFEFARHVLGQRQTAVPILRGYDQGYILRKAGSHSNSPWILSLGPVAVLAMVHCALHGMNGPRSIHRLAEHLAGYGVLVNRNDIAQNDLGQQLRLLGLVLDSPDAESGMLLLPPFAPSNHIPS
ncbi:hypothetical protein [Thiobacillus sp.]|uniref:hypothetical protein n=1 Tax=Thiobacillus sp. TaxID=924 RepID=UPI0025DAD5B0|nr:hypothetical protein [Thiobacillus sp.]